MFMFEKSRIAGGQNCGSASMYICIVDSHLPQWIYSYRVQLLCSEKKYFRGRYRVINERTSFQLNCCVGSISGVSKLYLVYILFKGYQNTMVIRTNQEAIERKLWFYSEIALRC